MSRQFATIYDIFCPVPFLPSPFGFRRLLKKEIAQSRLFYREMGCPVQWSLAISSEPTSAQQSQIAFASADARRQATCKCERQWAGDQPVFLQNWKRAPVQRAPGEK